MIDSKVKDVIKDKIKFYSRNLFDIKNKEFGIFDVIFCRNVFIYFDKHKIIELSKKFLDHLNKNGYLFLGISESISDLTLPIKAVGTSVYTFDSNKNFEQKTKESTKRLIKVLCVDDSPTILALLKKILTKDHGFEVVDMALNGLECSDKLTKNKVDVITLDIHMPSQDGVEYLRKNFNKIHPPVIMISSVSRENSDLALSAIRLGASDFVEKPSMSNLEEKSEEIRMKIKSIVLSKEQKEKNIDKAPIFEVSNLDIPDCDKKIRIICANYFDMFKISSLLNSLKGNQPPVVLSIEGASSFDKNFSENLAIELRKSVSLVEKMQGCLKANTISVFDINDRFKELVSLYAQDEISVLVLGQLSQKTSQTLLGFSWSQLVLEDLGDGKGSKLLNDKADDILPVTSFEYVSTRFLCKK